MNKKIIKDTYKEIFKSRDTPSLKSHIEKFIELDKYLPYSSTFYCITNTQQLTFEFISKNMTACLGLDREELKRKGMRDFWGRMHPEDQDPWLKALNDLMEFTLSKISLQNRERISYAWNYRLKNGQGEYVNVLQNTTPLEFDSDNKPIIGLAHYTILPGEMQLGVCASAKMLNDRDQYETIYFSNFSQKLLKDGITNRERDVIRLLALDKSSKQIGENLNISSNTVDTHRRNILKKLNMSSTGELVGMLKMNRNYL
ncbi:LuxR C-terminal-related transcriptional regulator [Algibacter miyuki]|uniref:LuxR C-terminal-related transcriptional regulator n=1 Tax=Algibacter miyuki TaxID=1306933 RepID=A0ABV5H2I8_9FLAO|nr:LuxR C-terminal-related transcriptional regulator [Algibacter miyuki]MDN3666298.1 LuxR C-terminal-related transcriptional regulator [Algibacter miyuki]